MRLFKRPLSLMISIRDAYRLLQRFGARAAGGTLLVSRDVLEGV